MTARLQLNPEEQHQLLTGLTRLLVEVLPDDWQQLIVDYRQVGNHVHVAVGVRKPDGSLELWEPPEESWLYFQKLRHGMYSDEHGTWFSMRFIIDPPHNFQVKYNYRNLPDWGDAPAEDFNLDLERYPRSEDNIPEWFRAKLV